MESWLIHGCKDQFHNSQKSLLNSKKEPPKTKLRKKSKDKKKKQMLLLTNRLLLIEVVMVLSQITNIRRLSRITSKSKVLLWSYPTTVLMSSRLSS